MSNKVILLVGTHHTPAIELIKQLRSDPDFTWQIEYVGHLTPNETHLKNTIIPKLKINFHQLESGKFDRRWLPNTVGGLPKIATALRKSAAIINRTNPDIIVSFGGYISVPIVIAGWLKHIPIITHEQTTTISLSTKINSLFTTKVALSFPASNFSSKHIVTGNLLRSEIFQTNSTQYQKLDQQLSRKPLLFITGGNQGSTIINQTILQLLPKLESSFTIIHQTGIFDLPQHLTPATIYHHYYPTDYVKPQDIGWVLNRASIVISRAGANYCQEIAVLKKRAILIPLPHSQQNEQLKNALWVKRQLPPTIIISQNQLTPNSLYNAIQKLQKCPGFAIVPEYTPNLKLLYLIHEMLH